MGETARDQNESGTDAPPSAQAEHTTGAEREPRGPVTTEDEKRLLEQIYARLGNLPAPTGRWIETYVRRSDMRLVRPLTDPDAYRFIQFGHRFLRELRRIAADSPELLAVSGVPGLTYDGAIEVFIGLIQWTIAQRGARLVSTDDGSLVLLPDGIAFALSVRQRLLLCIEGNGSEPQLAKALRRHILLTRRKHRSRPALLTELGIARAKIRALVVEVRAALEADPEVAAEKTKELLSDPDALLEAERTLSPWAPTVQEAVLALEQLLSHLDDAIDRLHRAIDIRRVPKTPGKWGRPVQVLMVAMDYVFNALVRHASATAEDGPLGQLVRLFAEPEQKGGAEPASAEEEESREEEESAVGEEGSQTSDDDTSSANAGEDDSRKNPPP